jgi:hypothetical protein
MKKYLLLAFVLVMGSSISAQNMNLRINEIIASNKNGQMDDFFDRDDWIEIYNPPGSAITDLAGYYITDDPADLTKWQIPSTDPIVTTVLPGSFIVLWADKDGHQGAHHIDTFSLSADGESVLLVAPDGQTVIDSVTFPQMAPDISYGRSVDGAGEWVFFNNVTYKASNFEQQATDVVFINEVQTRNVSYFPDPAGEYDQWIEIYNPNDYQINLANYSISIDGGTPWQIPNNNPYRTYVPANGFRLIWFDNQPEQDANHAPLTLNPNGGTITIYGPDGSTLDTYTYGDIAVNQSYGRQSDGAATSIVFTQPTPTLTNQLLFITPQTVYINEVMTANQNDIVDELGTHEDWIEIYNPNNFPVYLGGYYLSDNPENRTKWRIPTSFPDSVTVPANGFLLFWADDDDEQGVRHARFKLSNNGEYLGLFSPDGFTIVDQISWGYIAPDISYGRLTDGSPEWVQFIQTTPNASNNGATVSIAYAEEAPLFAYPNPTTDIIYFNEVLNVDLYSVSGALLERHILASQLNVSHLSSGIYLLKSDKGKVLRIIKN